MAKDRGPDARALDVAAFCRGGHGLAGHTPLATLRRLADGLALAPGDAAATWSALGSLVPVTGAQAELWLALRADAQVWLQCQRCLEPMAEHLGVDRRFRFVHDEDDAARLDEESEDDVLPLPARLDLHALLEDELILALPLVPRHAACPVPLAAAAQAAADAKPNPFAVLAALRDGRPGGQD